MHERISFETIDQRKILYACFGDNFGENSIAMRSLILHLYITLARLQ